MTPDEASSRASSVDGVSFRYRGPIGAQLRLGGYVLLSSPAGERLGQVLSQDVVEVDGRRAIEGHGRLVAAGADPQPFEDSDLAPAPVGLLRETLHDRAAPLEVGSLRFADEVGAGVRIPPSAQMRCRETCFPHVSRHRSRLGGLSCGLGARV
jgi:hypothetical protein